MKTIKTSELKGASLDWAVAKADGKTPKIDCVSFQDAFIYRIYLGWSYAYSSNGSVVKYTPSTDWAQGGPIIEKGEVCLWSEGYDWEAKIQISFGEWVELSGSTPLIAAMRCYVASKLGDKVDVPEELL